MGEEYLNYIELLEKALASFYEQLKNKTELDAIKTVLEFMETHSFAHADKVDNLKNSFRKPHLETDLITNYQNNLTHDVAERIERQSNLSDVLQILSDSEGSLGDLYVKVAEHLAEMAEYYKHVSEAVMDIARDEFAHRDILLKDKEKLRKR